MRPKQSESLGSKRLLLALGAGIACIGSWPALAQLPIGEGSGSEVSRGLNFRIVIPTTLRVELQRQPPGARGQVAAPLSLQVATSARSLAVSTEAEGGESRGVFSTGTRRRATPKGDAALQFNLAIPSTLVASAQGSAGARQMYTVSTP